MKDSVSHNAAAPEHWLESNWMCALSGGWLVVLLCFSVMLYKVGYTHHWQPLALDFMAFWATSKLALSGHAGDAYTLSKLVAAAHAAYPTYHPPGLWSYPPTFLLVILPTSLLPFGLSSAVFGACNIAVLIAAFRKMLPYRYVPLLVLTFPGVWVNFVQAQNAALTAGLAGLALFFLPRRPLLAGFFVGLLAIKPHLGVLFPVALICSRQWRAFAMAALTTCVFAALPLVYFDASLYRDFWLGLIQAQNAVSSNDLPQVQMMGVFPDLRLRQVAPATAYAVHLAVAALAVAATAYAWRVSRQPWMRAAVLVPATFLCSPYLFNYDALWFVLPIAFFNLQARQTGWLRGERAVLLLGWVYPIVGTDLTTYLNFSMGPFVSGALLLLGLRRIRQERRGMLPLVLG